MANKTRGERALQGDGENYTLVLSSNAIAQAEGQLGYGIGVVMSNIASGAFSINETTTLLWAALLKHHGPLSLADAGEIMDEIVSHYGDFGKVIETLAECVDDALPTPKTKAGGSPNRTQKAALRSGTRKKAGGSSRARPTEQD